MNKNKYWKHLYINTHVSKKNNTDIFRIGFCRCAYAFTYHVIYRVQKKIAFEGDMYNYKYVFTD